MTCSDPRHSDEQRAKAALEEMDDTALAGIVLMMEEAAKKHPRPPRVELKIISPAADTKPKL